MQSCKDDNSDFEDSVQVDKESGEIYDMQKKAEVTKISSNHEISLKSCPVANVTVFIDRAEVSRNIEVDLVPGDVAVMVKDLPLTADSDSIRVSCYGSATIVEVGYQEKAVTDEESAENIDRKSKTEEEIESITQRISKLTKDRDRLYFKIKVVEDEQEILKSYSKCVTSQKGDKMNEVLEKTSIENMLAFLNIYQERNAKLIDELFELKVAIERIDKEVSVLRINLDKLSPGEQKIKKERNVSILLEANKHVPVKLVLSYVVFNASWNSLYDVRVNNKDSSVQILYFATIKQNTGEDWKDAKLSLSTAMPSVGGSPPDLPTQTLSFEMSDYGKSICARFSFRKKKYMANHDVSLRKSAPQSGALGYVGLFDDNDSSSSESSLPVAEASENITSTNFEIVRPATIQSDDVGHKVSICQLDFKPQFEYNTIPKSVAHAFLKIKVKNESTCALLAGDAKVFLDNSFITKSTLPAVSPMEEFEVSVGVDPAVKVTYKPLRKFQQTTGMICKSVVFNNHQQIEVKNTKQAPVKITVIDQCPMSSSDKIKVTLQEPEMKLSKPGSANELGIIKNGNSQLHTANYKLEWVLDIPASQTKTINLRYQVEYPFGGKVLGI